MPAGATFNDYNNNYRITDDKYWKEIIKCFTRVFKVIYYTADHHFGHKNIIRFCNRPFKNTEEMDETLIDNWNSAVSKNDVVYVLGKL